MSNKTSAGCCIVQTFCVQLVLRIAQYMMLKAGYIAFDRWRVLVKAWIFEFWMQILKLHVCCSPGNVIEFWTCTLVLYSWAHKRFLSCLKHKVTATKTLIMGNSHMFLTLQFSYDCWGSFAAAVATFQWPKHFFRIPLLQIVVLMLLLRSVVPKHLAHF